MIEKIGKGILGIAIILAILIIGMTIMIGWEQTKVMINFLWQITGGLLIGVIKGIINGMAAGTGVA